MLSLLTRQKSFRDPWVGHPGLNRRWQLHRHRVQLAETLCLWRRLLRPAQLSSLERDGFVALENFLPQPEFEALRDEVEAVVGRASRLHPVQDNTRPGFRPKQPFAGGFDRFDGGTLNRFLHIDPEQMPRAAAFSHDQRLSAGSRQVIGLPMNPRKLDIYLTVHGEETRTPDLQKVLHRDTFFRALKFWFFCGRFNVRTDLSNTCRAAIVLISTACVGSSPQPPRRPNNGGSQMCLDPSEFRKSPWLSWVCPSLLRSLALPTLWCWQMCSAFTGAEQPSRVGRGWRSTAGTAPIPFLPSAGDPAERMGV